MLSATLPRRSVGCWGTHATSRRQSVDTQRRSTPPTVIAPAARLAGSRAAAPRRCSCPRRSRRPARRSRRAPARGRARRGPSPGGPGRRRTPARGAPALARGSGPAGRSAGGRAGASSSANIRSATARPSALAWYSAPSRRNGRYSSGASTSTVRPAWSPSPPSASRTPTVTATSATPRVAASSSTVPDRKVRRSVSIVARRWRSPTSASTAACAGRDRTRAASAGRARRRGSPSTGRRRACQRSRVRCSVSRPISHMNTGTSGSVTAMIERRFEVHATTREHDQRDDRGEHDLRQVAGEVRLERVDALHGDRGDLAGLRPVDRGGLRRRRRADEAPGAARRGRSTPRAGPRPPSPTATHPGREGEHQQTASRRSSLAGAPAKAPATIRASSVAWSRPNAVVTTPSAVSAISSGRTDRVRRTRRGSRARTRPQLVGVPAAGGPAARPATTGDRRRGARGRRGRSSPGRGARSG